ncbi:MAG: TIR domain-containing protein [Nitrospira sp.]|jgi:hypothetical protein|nr:TIR domain-containing protein [Nitrospira sp.]MDI3467832.1 hypothetical protein [Nitrospira sp.]
MPSVFLSYSHEDLLLIEELAAQLQASSDISIWRDQEKIYGGQKWPKVLGEAIADQDVFLLAWSKNSATSHFVELEWNTAIALKKTIVPCLLDDTALAPILSALHGPRLEDVSGLITSLRAAPLADAQRRNPVISSLATVTATDKEAALKQAKTMFAQQSLIILGDVYQAGRDIHIHHAPEHPRDRDTKNLLNAVRSTWIKGYLEPNLKDSRTITLHKTIGSDQVDHPLKNTVGLPNAVSRDVPQGKRLIELFDDATGFLLILGEPGSGKTISLLELAVGLLDRAEADADEPVPVILNLSTWSGKWNSFTDWMVDGLGDHYRVPKDLGRSLIKDRRLHLLLDGLDEIPAESRAACVQAINSFLTDRGAPGMVVCSRTSEYSQLPTKLKLNAAVQLQSLTDSQISQYIEDVAGKRSLVLRNLIESDETLRELAQSPLMLSIMRLAYEEAPEYALELRAATTSKDRHTRLFNRYVKTMLERKGTSSRRYAAEVVTSGLSWLATQLKKHSQTTFYLEKLQPSWLVRSGDRWLYWIFSRTIPVALVVGLLISIIGLVSLISIWKGALGNLQGPKNLLLGLGIIATYPLLFGLIFGLPAGILDGLLLGTQGNATKQQLLPHRIKHVSAHVLTYGAIGGLVGLLVTLNSSKADWLFIWILVIEFGLLGLIPGFRSAKRTLVSDIRTTETLPWSWEKAGRAYLMGPILVFAYLAIAIPIASLFYYFDMNSKLFVIVLLFLLAIVSTLIFVYRAQLMQSSTYRMLLQLRSLVFFAPGQTVRILFLIQMVIGVLSYIAWYLLEESALGKVGAAISILDASILSFGLVFATFGGIQRRSISSTPSYPNQGIVLSIKNAFFVSSFALPLILLFMVAWWFIAPKGTSKMSAFMGTSMMPAFLIYLLPIAAWFGTDVVQHYVLRTILYWRGATPRHYVEFLNYAVSLIFLRKVGGGYVFIHRLILEHFAAMSNQGNTPTPKNP